MACREKEGILADPVDVDLRKEGVKSIRNPQAKNLRVLERSFDQNSGLDGRNSVSKGVLINIAIPGHVLQYSCIAILNSCYFMVPGIAIPDNKIITGIRKVMLRPFSSSGALSLEYR